MNEIGKDWQVKKGAHAYVLKNAAADHKREEKTKANKVNPVSTLHQSASPAPVSQEKPKEVKWKEDA